MAASPGAQQLLSGDDMTDSKSALLFAGQGAQFVGMCADISATFPECKLLFDHASQVLGWDLGALCFKGPETELTRSDRCQPAVFVVGVAALKALEMRIPGLAWTAAAGLSLGEWTALHVAGVLSFEDTLRVLEARGRFMQQSCEERPGGMLCVIGLPDDKLREVCAKTGLETANFNSQEQTVLSGDRDRIADAAKLATELGAKRAISLNVAGAYHSSLMAGAARSLEDYLGSLNFQAPKFPVLSNVTGEPHNNDPAEIRRLMVRQVTSSVRWVDCVGWFQGQDVTRYVECGPGRVLSGLVKKIAPQSAVLNVQDLASLDKAATAMRPA